MVEKPDEFLVWFTGVGKELNWACRACAEKYPAPPLEWIPVSEEWLLKNRNEVYWDGVRGAPETKYQATNMCFSGRDLRLDETWGGFVDVQPYLGKPSCWYALSKSGALVLFSTSDSSVISSCRLGKLKFDVTAETAICVSPQNDFVVISESSGPNAALVDMKSGEVIKELSRGDYHSENSFFPTAFFEHQGESLLIAASDWNRLDIYDPNTGGLLTQRGPTSYVDGNPPPHYLDYFHGSLRVSPGSQTVVDNGWVWSPTGVIRSWSLSAWLLNPYESEDGPTSKSLAQGDFWDGSLCWIDSTTLAIWGWGRDEWVIPAVALMNVRTGKVVRWFPGPKVRQPSAWPPRKLADSLFFDRYLFAVSDEAGTSVWNIETGECLLVDANVKPWRYHPDSREFLELLPDSFRLTTLIA